MSLFSRLRWMYLEYIFLCLGVLKLIISHFIPMSSIVCWRA